MKKLLLIAGLLTTLTLLPTQASANQSVAYIPKGCDPIGAEYSTGGGDKAIQYFEVMCEFSDGSKAIYIDRILSVGGMFGVGRFTQPDKIIFKHHNKDELIVK